MIRATEAKALRRWLSASYTEGGCPPAGSFLETAEDLTPSDGRRLEEHVSSCPACAAERDLERLFEAPEAEVSRYGEDVRQIATALAIRFGGEVTDSQRPADDSRGTGAKAWAFALAATLATALAALLYIQQAMAPPLPEGGPEGVVRGAILEVVAPVGEVEVWPESFRWVDTSEADRYRIRVVAVDDAVLWEADATGSPTTLSAELRDRLDRAVRYYWSVDALAGDGTVVASSERVWFRVLPAREEPSKEQEP